MSIDIGSNFSKGDVRAVLNVYYTNENQKLTNIDKEIERMITKVKR